MNVNLIYYYNIQKQKNFQYQKSFKSPIIQHFNRLKLDILQLALYDEGGFVLFLVQTGEYMLHFALCDDNKNTLEKTTSTLESIFCNADIEADIAFASTSSRKLLDYLSENQADVVLLDIDLSNKVSGIELAKKIREVNKYIYIIFITAHFEYSMLAYKVKTFDFLVKPITYESLKDTIVRLRDDIYGNKNCFVKFGRSKQYIRANDIIYIEKDKAKATVHTTETSFQIYATVEEIISCLPGYFVRCNKSFIINTNRVSQIDMHERNLSLNKLRINYTRKYVSDERKMISNEGITN